MDISQFSRSTDGLPSGAHANRNSLKPVDASSPLIYELLEFPDHRIRDVVAGWADMDEAKIWFQVCRGPGCNRAWSRTQPAPDILTPK